MSMTLIREYTLFQSEIEGVAILAATYLDDEGDMYGTILGKVGNYLAVLRTSKDDDVKNVGESSLAFYLAAKYYVESEREYFAMIIDLLETIAKEGIDAEGARAIVVSVIDDDSNTTFSLN